MHQAVHRRNSRLVAPGERDDGVPRVAAVRIVRASDHDRSPGSDRLSLMSRPSLRGTRQAAEIRHRTGGTRGRADWSPLGNRTGGQELFSTTARGWNGMERDGTPHQ